MVAASRLQAAIDRASALPLSISQRVVGRVSERRSPQQRREKFGEVCMGGGLLHAHTCERAAAAAVEVYLEGTLFFLGGENVAGRIQRGENRVMAIASEQ